MSLSIEGMRTKSGRVLDAISPTRIIWGNLRTFRLRELPSGALDRVLHPKRRNEPPVSVRRNDSPRPLTTKPLF